MKAKVVPVLLILNFFISLALAFSPSDFLGVNVVRVKDGISTDLFTNFLKTKEYSLLILGTYAADFNAIEYAQRLRYYHEKLRKKGVSRIGFVVNGSPPAVSEFAKLLSIPSKVELFSDEIGAAGHVFGVNKGWLSDEKYANISPYLKLFGMLWGLGASQTLPSVISGYVGNPYFAQPWIEEALAQGQLNGRWPNNALELDKNGAIHSNKFAELPLVGKWKRRPLELATLRLQNMLGVSLRHWNALKPSPSALREGVLTQLGGLFVVGPSGEICYEWRDDGICHVADFELLLEKLPTIQ